MIPEQATAFAARITDAIDRAEYGWTYGEDEDAWPDHYAADRLHVAAFLRALQRAEEGLRDCQEICVPHPPDLMPDQRDHALRWAEARDEAWAGLVRIGALYGVQP